MTAVSPVLNQLMLTTLLEGSVGLRSVDSTDDPDANAHFNAAGNAFVSVPLAERFSVQFDAQGEYNGDNTTRPARAR